MKSSLASASSAAGRVVVSLALLVGAVLAAGWWFMRPPTEGHGPGEGRVVVKQPSPVERSPSPYASAPPVPGPDRSPLDERAARHAARPVPEPSDPAAAKAAYRTALERYTELRFGGGSPTQLQEVARILDAGIDARVDRQEIALPDGLQLMAELLDVLEPDPARRGVLLAQWREQRLERQIQQVRQQHKPAAR